MALERPNLQFVSTLKYDLGKIIPFVDNEQYDVLSSSFCAMIKKLPAVGVFKITSEMYRPDLIAFKIYGNVKYKIPMMMYNDIYTIKECFRGRVIRYPSPVGLDTLLFSLAT